MTDLSASAGPDNIGLVGKESSAGPDNIGLVGKESSAGPDNIEGCIIINADRSMTLSD